MEYAAIRNMGLNIGGLLLWPAGSVAVDDGKHHEEVAMTNPPPHNCFLCDPASLTDASTYLCGITKEHGSFSLRRSAPSNSIESTRDYYDEKAASMGMTARRPGHGDKIDETCPHQRSYLQNLNIHATTLIPPRHFACYILHFSTRSPTFGSHDTSFPFGP